MKKSLTKEMQETIDRRPRLEPKVTHLETKLSSYLVFVFKDLFFLNKNFIYKYSVEQENEICLKFLNQNLNFVIELIFLENNFIEKINENENKKKMVSITKLNDKYFDFKYLSFYETNSEKLNNSSLNKKKDSFFFKDHLINFFQERVTKNAYTSELKSIFQFFLENVPLTKYDFLIERKTLTSFFLEFFLHSIIIPEGYLNKNFKNKLNDLFPRRMSYRAKIFALLEMGVSFNFKENIFISEILIPYNELYFEYKNYVFFFINLFTSEELYGLFAYTMGEWSLNKAAFYKLVKKNPKFIYHFMVNNKNRKKQRNVLKSKKEYSLFFKNDNKKNFIITWLLQNRKFQNKEVSFLTFKKQEQVLSFLQGNYNTARKRKPIKLQVTFSFSLNIFILLLKENSFTKNEKEYYKPFSELNFRFIERLFTSEVLHFFFLKGIPGPEAKKFKEYLNNSFFLKGLTQSERLFLEKNQEKIDFYIKLYGHPFLNYLRTSNNSAIFLPMHSPNVKDFSAEENNFCFLILKKLWIFDNSSRKEKNK